jgi:hypothetical protein
MMTHGNYKSRARGDNCESGSESEAKAHLGGQQEHKATNMHEQANVWNS